MNNMQLYLSIGIPTVTVILAWLSNKSDISALRAELNAHRAEAKADNSALRAEMKADMGALRTDMKADMGALRAEMKAEISSLRAEMKAEISSLRAEMLNLRKEIYEALIPLHERMAIIEVKQK